LRFKAFDGLNKSLNMVDDARLMNFFRDTKRIPFDDLESVLLVGVIKLEEGTNLNIKNIFDNVPIYTIPDWKRGTNKKVKIPHPGVPFTVLSAKSGKNIRGIVKNTNDLKTKEGNKGKFPNQVTLDIALADKMVNVMIFRNSMKITGATNPSHFAQTMIFLKALFSVMHPKIPVWDKSLTVTKVDVIMENVVFDLGYPIKKDMLVDVALQEGLESPSEDDAARVLFPMGFEKAKGGDRYFNFRILHTGKVVFSGNNRKEMKPIYDKFMDFIEKHEAEIRFV
jgi:hypothetical protein